MGVDGPGAASEAYESYCASSDSSVGGSADDADAAVDGCLAVSGYDAAEAFESDAECVEESVYCPSASSEGLVSVAYAAACAWST